MRWAAALLALALALPAAAQWPNRPVRLAAAPGAPEFLARTLAPALAAQLRIPVVVETRERVAGETADGYTALVFGNDGSLADAGTLEPVSMLAVMPFVVLAGAQAGFGTLAGLIEVARHNPGELYFATLGAGSPQHLAGEYLFQRAGVRLVHAPYREATRAASSTVVNDTQVLVETAAAALAYVRVGALKPLAVTTQARFAGLPEVPTVAEAGLPDFRVGLWYAVGFPAGVPAPLVAQMGEALRAALADPQVAQAMAEAAFAPAASTPAQARAHVKSELARWQAVRERAGIR
jgi:tripartite-type tricarboxylate transporter receptor subunit TctC